MPCDRLSMCIERIDWCMKRVDSKLFMCYIRGDKLSFGGIFVHFLLRLFCYDVVV